MDLYFTAFYFSMNRKENILRISKHSLENRFLVFLPVKNLFDNFDIIIFGYLDSTLIYCFIIMTERLFSCIFKLEWKKVSWIICKVGFKMQNIYDKTMQIFPLQTKNGCIMHTKQKCRFCCICLINVLFPAIRCHMFICNCIRNSHLDFMKIKRNFLIRK